MLPDILQRPWRLDEDSTTEQHLSQVKVSPGGSLERKQREGARARTPDCFSVVFTASECRKFK